MDEKNENNPKPSELPQPDWQDLPFDDTTNFSILGWLLDKFGRGKDPRKSVDFTLGE